MKRLALPLLLALATAAALAAGETGDVRASAEIQISLPDGVEPRVSIKPSTNRITLVLPRGSVFPLDFQASSGGMLRGGGVSTLEDDRLLLELELARGVLDRVDYEAGGVTLRFISVVDAMSLEDEALDVYRIGPEDRLRITVHNQADLSSDVTVSGEGTISLPVLGEIVVDGMSQRQLAARLTELLAARDILKNPQVDVEIEEYRNQWVMVTGEVRSPGKVPLRGGTTLKEVLAEAMGFTEKSGEQITVSRKLAGRDDYRIIRVDRTSFESGATDPPMEHGDIVDVSRATFCYVQGEVRSPSRVPVEPGLTLLKALTQVGGLTEWADRKQVRILYPLPADAGGEGIADNGQAAHNRRGVVVNLRKIQNGEAADPVLRGGEIVIVKRRYF